MDSESLFIVSNPRSGSTQLVQYLRQVPGCACYGEIFKHETLPRELKLHADDVETAQKLYESDLKKFWAFLLEHRHGNPKYVGAKIFPRHRRNEPVWDMVFSHDSRVIHLWRARVFDTHVSSLRAQESGQWNLKQGEKPATDGSDLMHFDRDKYLQFRKVARREYNATKARLKGHPMSMQIEYSEIAAPDALARRLSGFFGVPVTLQPTLQKLATKPAIDYLENPADAAPYVDDLLNETDQGR